MEISGKLIENGYMVDCMKLRTAELLCRVICCEVCWSLIICPASRSLICIASEWQGRALANKSLPFFHLDSFGPANRLSRVPIHEAKRRVNKLSRLQIGSPSSSHLGL